MDPIEQAIRNFFKNYVAVAEEVAVCNYRGLESTVPISEREDALRAATRQMKEAIRQAGYRKGEG